MVAEDPAEGVLTSAQALPGRGCEGGRAKCKEEETSCGQAQI